MKQLENKQIKNKRVARLRKIISIIGGTIGFAMAFYKIRTKQRKEKQIHKDVYIPIGKSLHLNEEIAATKEIFPLNGVARYIEEKANVYEKIIKDILQNELLSAKKVWVTNSNHEEVQVEKYIFEENGHFFLGNSRDKIILQDIYKLKYRSKIYFDRDSINS